MIAGGRIQVNGETVCEQGIKVDPVQDDIRMDGRVVRRESKVVYILNKPPGVMCTNDDPQSRPLYRDLFPADAGRLFPVGRLDCMSEGLLLVTNDGDLAHRLMHPRYGFHKTYLARTPDRVTAEQMKRMEQGVEEGGERLRALRVRRERGAGPGTRLRIVLGEGRNRHIRRMFKALGLRIDRLKRVKLGPLVLGGLPQGSWRELRPQELRQLQVSSHQRDA
ncbi:Ribosomal large subunit pseudouridine synthase B [Kiritimatiella glycovorans]|uniref:Pseudouridine synthase n=2 Tax=Kiritimatiella glycovorans TaxID=1307763 RepID=A0A0G3ED31_9BACT|nr:Ribosomal large subunit pseudouridine synthase B [Kiritimatiella glycovorans]